MNLLDDGDKTIRDFYGRILGKYDAATNTTRDFYGRVVAKGERLTMLSRSKQTPAQFKTAQGKRY